MQFNMLTNSNFNYYAAVFLLIANYLLPLIAKDCEL